MILYSNKRMHAPEWIAGAEEKGTLKIFRLKGDLDAFAVAKLERFAEALRKVKGYKPKHMILNFAEVTSIDSTVMASLLKTLGYYKKMHRMLAISNASKELQYLMWLAKVSHLFPTYATEEQAVKDLETRF